MKRMASIAALCAASIFIGACTHDGQERKIEFVYLALGGSDVIGLGARPLTEGYIYLINQDLEQRIRGTFLLSVGVPGARIDSLSDHVHVIKRFGGAADLATVWIGVDDLVHGHDPSRFQSKLRELLRTLQTSVSTIVVIANVPDLTQLSAFRDRPSATVTLERVQAFNRAIEVEAPYVNASIVNVFDESSPDDFAYDVDGFHPINAGHHRMAVLFRKAILERLRPK